jgi:hypothetical protein
MRVWRGGLQINRRKNRKRAQQDLLVQAGPRYVKALKRARASAATAHGWEQNGCDRVVDSRCNKVEANILGGALHSRAS